MVASTFKSLSSQPYYTKRPSPGNASSFPLIILRDSLTIQTWLLIGAIAQVILFSLPIRTVYATSPAILLLFWSIIDTALMSFGLKRNVYMDGVILGKSAALIPSKDGSFERRPKGMQDKTPGGEKLVCFMLGFRSNSPLGLIDPGYQSIVGLFQDMNKDLEANAADNGFLGVRFYLNAQDRSSGNEILSIFYFRSIEDSHKFAYSPVHRKGWDWFNANTKKYPHLSILHELYEAPAGKWENVYVNCKPTLFGTTSHPINADDGTTHWVDPLVDANRGRVRSSAGRLGGDERDDYVPGYD